MTYSHGPREGAPKTIRLEDQPLPEREVSFYTPRAGDWLLLAVLVVALLGIGARVWSQLGWGDQVGQAIFFGLLLMAIYWATLIYTFKLSLAVRVGPQGLAIVRGPWRVELRWGEITRLMERPQMISGRRYRWVVALSRDGRRIQVREDALLDYERFRREVYQRYRMWRDHGGTWGATGGGPFVAKESVAESARWWALAGLMIALPGIYLALLLPAARLEGYALLALAALCLVMVVGVFLRRRTYALDGRMIEARGMSRRIQLAWRDVSKVERTRHPAGGAILAAIAAGRLALRLAARGDAGIRGFAWSPRVPEYLTLRGGGRHARIRLHHLAQPEELLAWVEFYTGVRRASPSRPLEPSAEAARRAGAASAADVEELDEQTPDLSGVSGPADPWGSGRRGKPVSESARRAASEPRVDPIPEPAFSGAPLGASFREPGGLDQPPEFLDSAGAEDARNEEAWLRETGALLSMSGGAAEPPPNPRRAADAIADAQTIATPATPATPPTAAPRSRQFVRPPFSPRRATSAPPNAPHPAPTSAPPNIPPATPSGAPPSTPQRPPAFAPPFTPHAAPQPRPESPFAPYNPDMPEETPVEAPPAMPVPVMPAPIMPEPITPAAPPAWGPPPPSNERVPTRQSERAGLDGRDAVDEDAGEGAEGEEEEAPWRRADWQPPVLPRFGPQNAQPAEEYAPRRDGGQTDR